MSADANQKNPISPSEQFSMNEQLMYKLASLDASVQAGFRRLDEKMDRFQTDLHESQISTNDRINSLDKEFHEAILRKRNRLDSLEGSLHAFKQEMRDQFSEVNTWQQVAMAKIGIITTSIAIVWIVFAPTIRGWLGIANM